jgi:hypothetical protein
MSADELLMSFTFMNKQRCLLLVFSAL